jgi:predicted LPLAT superfamily acyltransferase
VDLNDVCLDISLSVSIVWRPTPTVAFATTNPSICDGACTTVNVSFTGSAPFELTYSNPASGAATLVFGGNSGSFEVCAPVGTSAGNFVLQATALADSFCSCP